MAAAALALGLLPAATAVADARPAGARPAADPVELDPADLDRGPDIAVPYVEDGELIWGERRIDVDAPVVRYLGRAGRAQLLATTDRQGTGQRRVLRVRPDGTTKVLVRGVDPYTAQVSADGKRFLDARIGNRSTRVRVWSARTGRLIADRRIAGQVGVVAAVGKRVLLRTWDDGTWWWSTNGDADTPLTGRIAYAADPTTNRLASYTGDPYDGGCTVVSALDRPGKRLWRSCRERVQVFSPDGRRMATVPLLSDGLGPADVLERTVTGTELAHWTTGRWFGLVRWEDADTLLLETNGDSGERAVVRCSDTACENATDPRPVEEPRPLAPTPALPPR